MELEELQKILINQAEKTQRAIEQSELAEILMENNDEILLNLVGGMGELKGQVSEGFKAVHQRLDILNGRTAKSEGKIDLIEKQQATSDGRMLGISWVFGGITALIMMLLTALGIYVSYIR